MVDSIRHIGARSPEYALLGFLYQKPGHGYSLHRKLAGEMGHVWHVSQSQTYNILRRLETQGFVTSRTRPQAKLPARQVLSITEAGCHRFEEWLQTPTQSSVRAIRLEFITRLYFARLIFPELLQSIFRTQSAAIQTTLARLQDIQVSIPAEQTFNRLSLDLRIQQLQALGKWVRQCRQEFEIQG